MNDYRQQTNTGNMGKGMMVVAMIMALGLLTYIFQGAIDKQFNPNQSIRATQTSTHHTEITLKRNRSGHYVGTGSINKHKAVFLLDTGATYVAVPERMAVRLGLEKGRRIPLATANGRSFGYQSSINELNIGPIRLHNIKAIITSNLEEVLLGMSVLKQLEFTQRGNELIIRQYL